MNLSHKHEFDSRPFVLESFSHIGREFSNGSLVAIQTGFHELSGDRSA